MDQTPAGGTPTSGAQPPFAFSHRVTAHAFVMLLPELERAELIEAFRIQGQKVLSGSQAGQGAIVLLVAATRAMLRTSAAFRGPAGRHAHNDGQEHAAEPPPSSWGDVETKFDHYGPLVQDLAAQVLAELRASGATVAAGPLPVAGGGEDGVGSPGDGRPAGSPLQGSAGDEDVASESAGSGASGESFQLKSGGWHDHARALGLDKLLCAEHLDMLEESGIAPGVILRRGYRTVTDSDRRWLRELGFSETQSKMTPALLVPLFDVRGNLASHQLRPDVPRTYANDKKPRKYETMHGATSVLDLHPDAQPWLRDPKRPLVITEGAKKADAAVTRSLCCIALQGVWNWRGKNEFSGTQALAQWEDVPLSGRHVYIAFDSDVLTKPGVQKALQRLRGFLLGRGATVHVLFLPHGEGGEKTGLDDFLARGAGVTGGGTVEELWQYAHEMEEAGLTKSAKLKKLRDRANQDGIQRPEIDNNREQLRVRLNRMANAVGDYNEQWPMIYHGPGGLCHLLPNQHGMLSMDLATPPSIQVIAGEAANWVSTSEWSDTVRESGPTTEICKNYLASPRHWRNVPPLVGVATAPVYARNGVLHCKPGYDPDTKLWLELPAGFSLPDITPTVENVAKARDLIENKLLGGVAFVANDGGASKAHAIALMVLLFVRNMIDGATPLHIFAAPVQGSGKSYAAKICIAPFTEPTSYPEQNDEDEWRKFLITALLSGTPIIYIDNVVKNLNSAALAQAITESFIEDRLLGTMKTVRVQVRCAWVATANNPIFVRDSAVRSVVIRLDTKMATPENREFKMNPLEYIARNRGEVIGAILTLVENWKAQGRPDYAGPHRSRFASWYRVMGGILQANGIPGFLENVAEMRAELDPEQAAWEAFFSDWHDRFGEAIKSVVELLPLALDIPDLANALSEDERKQKQRMGRQLQLRKDRVYGNLALRRRMDTGRGSAWSLEQTEPDVVDEPIPDFAREEADDTPSPSVAPDVGGAVATTHEAGDRPGVELIDAVLQEYRQLIEVARESALPPGAVEFGNGESTPVPSAFVVKIAEDLELLRKQFDGKALTPEARLIVEGCEPKLMKVMAWWRKVGRG